MVGAFYAALFALLLVWLSKDVVRVHRSEKDSLDEGRHGAPRRRIRVYAYFTEYVPLGLIVLYVVESLWNTLWLTHALGLTLLAGRWLHAYGMAGSNRIQCKPRASGMILTLLALVVGALAILGAMARLHLD